MGRKPQSETQKKAGPNSDEASKSLAATEAKEENDHAWVSGSSKVNREGKGASLPNVEESSGWGRNNNSSSKEIENGGRWRLFHGWGKSFRLREN